MKEFAIHLDAESKKPLYEQIYAAIRDGILTGQIPTDEKLPSTRFEAEFLSCSRSTVELAYDQLLAEGYVRAEPYRGYYVCDVGELYHLTGTAYSRARADASPPFGRERTTPGGGEAVARIVDFSPNGVDLAPFPFASFGRTLRNLTLDEGEQLLAAGEAAGDYDLRCAISEYLFRSRNVSCAPEQIVLGAGNDYLLLLLAQILGKNRRIAMESPTYLRAYHTLKNLGYPIEAIPMDAEGICVDKLLAGDADVAYVMPSHHFPLGTVMPLKRRLALLAWADQGENRYLIEDDYDSEFRYKGKPIPALQGLDRRDRVIYLGTFSRSIAPAIRVSYLVLPPQLVRIYRESCGFYACTVPGLMQAAINRFMREGGFERNLNRMRGVYKIKHDFLLGELRKRPWVLRIFGENSGLHLLVEVKSRRGEGELVAAAAKEGIILYGLSAYFLHEQSDFSSPVFLLGYGGLTREEMKRGLDILEKLL